MTVGKYRIRTAVRRRLPWFLLRWGLAAKPSKDCGCHEWYRETETTARCYHCAVGVRDVSPEQDVRDL